MKTACRLWAGATNGTYPTIYRNGRKQYVHRWLFEQVGHVFAKNEVVKHACDNPMCFRFDHLSVGTQSENILEAYDRGSLSNRKLTDENVRAIRADDRTHRAIAADYGVFPSTIGNIKNGRSRKAVK